MTTKAELAVAVANALGQPIVTTKPYVDAVFDVIAANLVSGTAVKIAGFGNFEIRETKERRGHNPQTGADLIIKAGRKIVFKPSADLKGRV